MYTELCFRHINSKFQNEKLDPENLKNAWENYDMLFEIVREGNFKYKIPSAWIWDCLDEFIYQF